MLYGSKLVGNAPKWANLVNLSMTPFLKLINILDLGDPSTLSLLGWASATLLGLPCT